MGTNSGLGRILFVDDEVPLVEILAQVFREEGYEVEVAEERFEATRKARRFRPDLVLTNQNMPGGKGIDFAEDLLREGIETRLVMFSGMALGGKGPSPKACLERGFCDYLVKPTDLERIKEVVDRRLRDPDATNLRIARFAEITRTFLEHADAAGQRDGRS
ncbi:MAG: hypothetical protein Kow0092_28860 [Deferrisomatales bacterium]